MIAAAASLALALAAAGALPVPHPDIPVGSQLTAYVGPRFVTLEPFLPEATTVVADETGRVRALLSRAPVEGEYARIVRLPGVIALPGLHDAHLHVVGIGQARDQVALAGTKAPAEAKQRVAAWAKKNPGAAAVRGRGWDQSLFPGGAWPTAKDLDGATDKPVLLSRVDGHAAWANAAMLELAGITKDTKDPPGGKLIRDAKGEPTGVLIDNAIDLADAKLPAPTDADLTRWLHGGLAACADAGLTSVTDMGMAPRAARALIALDDAGKLPLRVFVYLDGAADDALSMLGARAPTARLAFLGVKLFADGAMGSRGAALLADYADDPGNKGLLLTEPKALSSRIAAAHKKGYAVAVHAIGDRGNRVVLDALDKNPAPAGVRDRIEHAQLVHPDDFVRFFARQVVASMQPTHATSDMRWAEQRVGKARLAGAYAWRRMLEAKVPVAFGSDAPVEDERPLPGIYAAVTRQDAAGQPPEGFLPDQRLHPLDAVYGFTVGAAYAVGRERELGALTPGMHFDVTLLSADPLAATAPATAWLTTKPVGIVVGGALRASPAR